MINIKVEIFLLAFNGRAGRPKNGRTHIKCSMSIAHYPVGALVINDLLIKFEPNCIKIDRISLSRYFWLVGRFGRSAWGPVQQQRVALICIDPSLILTLLLLHSWNQYYLRFSFTPTWQILDTQPKKIDSEPHLSHFLGVLVPVL